MAVQRGFTVDTKRCTGCKACYAACKAENNTRPQRGTSASAAVDYRRVVFSRDTAAVGTVNRRFVTTACYHCYNPACRAVCPVGAYEKRGSDGVVLINIDTCIGCRRCQFACPYGAPRFNSAIRKMEKCTFCYHRLADGRKPACVATCVGKALRDFSETADAGAWGDFVAPDADGAPGEGPPGGSLTYKRNTTDYNNILGVPVLKVTNTKPNVGFTE